MKVAISGVGALIGGISVTPLTLDGLSATADLNEWLPKRLRGDRFGRVMGTLLSSSLARGAFYLSRPVVNVDAEEDLSNSFC